MELRRYRREALDINGKQLKIGDKVKVTQERIDKYNLEDGMFKRLGEVLVIEQIYTMPSIYGDDLLGGLKYVDGSGSVWNSELAMYEKVSNPDDTANDR